MSPWKRNEMIIAFYEHRMKTLQLRSDTWMATRRHVKMKLVFTYRICCCLLCWLAVLPGKRAQIESSSPCIDFRHCVCCRLHRLLFLFYLLAVAQRRLDVDYHCERTKASSISSTEALKYTQSWMKSDRKRKNFFFLAFFQPPQHVVCQSTASLLTSSCSSFENEN